MRPGRGWNQSSATAYVTPYCTWRPSGLTIGLHEQGGALSGYSALRLCSHALLQIAASLTITQQLVLKPTYLGGLKIMDSERYMAPTVLTCHPKLY